MSGTDFDVMASFREGVAGDVRDPYPGLARKRQTTPVELDTHVGFAGGEVLGATVYRYDDVAAVLRDNQTFSSAAIRELMGIVMGPYVLVGMDEPEHKRHRALVSTAFRHKSLQRWESDVIHPIMNELIDSFADRGSAELVRDFTWHFPVQVIAEILGIPHTDHERFHDLAIAIINVAAQPEIGLAASEALRDYLSQVVDDRRSHPRDDLISVLVDAELDGERLGDEEIYSFLLLLLPAGAETTYRAGGNLLFGLLSNPDQLDAVRADRSLLPQAIEECIRWESPLLLTPRWAIVDTEIAGVAIPAGAEVILNIGSANHDETRWDDAERFDLFRPQQPHISFGVGPHMCLGMHLARLEMTHAVESLLDRLPDLRLDPDAVDPDGDQPHIHGERFRSPTALPVLFDAV